MAIREIIEDRLKQLGVRNRAVCIDLGFKEPNFSAFLKGRRTLPYDDLERVCEYLGLTLQSKDET